MEAEYAAIDKLVTTINMPYISEDERINAIADMFSYVAGTEYVLFDDKIRSRILRYVTNFIKPITTAAHNIAIVEPSVHKLCNRIQNEFDDIPPECERFVRFVQDLRNALPVGKAVESQDADTVTLALARYPDTIDARFMSQRINHMVTPLIQAVYDNQYNLSRKLLETGADPNIPDEKGNTPIGYAVERLPYLEPGDNTKLAVLLASHGASVDESVYHTLLSSTAEYSAYVPVYTIVTDIVRILSDGNRPLNLPQNILERVAHHSVRNKRSNEFDVQSAYKELVELLIENGAFIHYNSHVLMDYIAANNLKNIFASFIHAMEVAKLNLTAAAMYENAIASADIKNKSDYKFEHIDGMTILTIPTGSLLYHSFNIPAKDDIESQTLKLMGGIVPNGSVITFKEASTRGGESASGTTVLEQSYVARRAGTFWPKEDCLIPAKDVPSRTRGGRRQTRRSSRRRKTRVQIPHNTAVPITNLVKWKNTRKNTVQNKLSAHNEPTAAATPASNKGKILDNIKDSLHYTPPPMTDEEREQIKHALSLPFDDPTNPTDMSAKTHALMHALLTVGKNPKPGQFKIV